MSFQKYLRSLDSLDQTKTGVFKEVDETINNGYCDQEKAERYNLRMRSIDNRIKGLREEGIEDKQR